jgi:hypothetical protein
LIPLQAGAAPLDDSPRLSPGLLIASTVEVGVAIAVSALILRAGHASPTVDQPGSAMTSMHSHRSAEIPWHTGTLVVAALTAVTLIWWLATRAQVPAVLAAAGLAGLGTAAPMRMLALESHLIGMATLEVLIVAVPLLIVAAVPRRTPNTGSRRSPAWTLWVFVAVLANSALLIALHLPAIHDRGARLERFPLWLAILLVVVGLGYWAAVLLSAQHVRPALRRRALIIGQEVGAILGLATLLGPGLHPHHSAAFGMSAELDQRLGGALMLITCAAVTLPLARRLEPQHRRTERNVL